MNCLQLSADQRKELLVHLSTKSTTEEGRPFSIRFEHNRDADTTAFANELITLFRAAHWNVLQTTVLPKASSGQLTLDVRYHSEFLSPSAAAQTVLAAFAAADMNAEQNQRDAGPNCDVCICVGGS